MAPGCAQMTRTWIVYNKPKVASYTHAGMIMGLGLTSGSTLPIPCTSLGLPVMFKDRSPGVSLQTLH